MKPATWLHILLYNTPSETKINAFRDILLSPIVQYTADKIESEVIAELLVSRVDLKIKDPRTLQNMFIDIINRPAISDAYLDISSPNRQKNKATPSEVIHDEVIDALSKELQSMKEAIKEGRINVQKAERHGAKMERKAKYYKSQLTKSKKTKYTKKKRNRG